MSRPTDDSLAADLVPYRSWRAWFRVRYRTRCQVCGEETAGHRTQRDAAQVAYRHLAWHGLLGAILRRAVRDGLVPDERG